MVEEREWWDERLMCGGGQDLMGVYVNIYDVLHHEWFFQQGQQANQPLRRHTTAKRLGRYSKRQKKIFPKVVVKEEMTSGRLVLRYLKWGFQDD